ncbi:MAG: hypothetical protein ICV60_23665, partial [Pyrinomonadaceae bacterium]|nr:hypothetical protein [Pyrinomonadaceae bacterium]
YNYAGMHEPAVEHLSYLVDEEQADERRRLVASPELRRYVHILRKLEREPAEAPQTMAAIRSLERNRRARAAALLAESREQVKAGNVLARASASQSQTQSAAPARMLRPEPHAQDALHASPETPQKPTPVRRQSALSPPPPIAEVLRDVYEEEKKTA